MKKMMNYYCFCVYKVHTLANTSLRSRGHIRSLHSSWQLQRLRWRYACETQFSNFVI